jgi:hypothetical protein
LKKQRQHLSQSVYCWSYFDLKMKRETIWNSMWLARRWAEDEPYRRLPPIVPRPCIVRLLVMWHSSKWFLGKWMESVDWNYWYGSEMKQRDDDNTETSEDQKRVGFQAFHFHASNLSADPFQ